MVNRMTTPPAKSGGNKAVISIFVLGTVILAAGIAIMVVRNRTDDDADRTTRPVVTPPPPSPSLVALPPEEPPPPAEPDTDPPEEAAEEAEPKRRAPGGGDPTGGKEGTLDVAATNRFINANFAQVRTCYERRLKIHSMLEGHLDLKIRLTPRGTVGSIRVNSDTVRDSEMLECVMRTIRGWNFPAPEDGWVVFDKSFRFQPTK